MKRMTRLEERATMEERRVFAQTFNRTLDDLGIPPGGEFYITTTGGTARTRRGDPSTSRDAAASVGDLRASQRAVLKAFESYGSAMTDEGLVAYYGTMTKASLVPEQSDSGLRSRRSELVDRGLIFDTGQTETMTTGRKAILWGLSSQAQSLDTTTTPQPTVASHNAIFGYED